MFSHRQIWNAIDALAAHHSLSPSGLAKLAGLDPTTFNKSKRLAADGRQRWPNTESLSKVLQATNTAIEDFTGLMTGRDAVSVRHLIPLIGLAQAGGGGFFNDGGFPVGGGWEEVAFPGMSDENAYALEVSGDSMEPIYRDGDTIIVSPNADIRRGDRVVVKTGDGEVMAKILQRDTAHTIELASINPDHKLRVLAKAEIDWMARIIWASQ